MKILLVDNFDSFSFNLAEALERLGAAVTVTRNHVDRARARQLAEASDLVVLSPGPGRPETAGISIDLLRDLEGRIPVLGVCLGHQCIAISRGGRVDEVGPVHGKADRVEHDGQGAFADLPNPLMVARYHSLAVTEVPDTFRIQARTTDGITMAALDPDARQLGVQFHPESILTPRGQRFLEQAVDALLATPGGRS